MPVILMLDTSYSMNVAPTARDAYRFRSTSWRMSINPVPLVSGYSSSTLAQILARRRRHTGAHRRDVIYAITTAQDPSHERC